MFEEGVPGRLLIILRELAGLEQKEIARRLDIDRRRWRSYEKGPLFPNQRLLNRLLGVVGFVREDLPAILCLAELSERRRRGELPFESQPVPWPEFGPERAPEQIVEILTQFFQELRTLTEPTSLSMPEVERPRPSRSPRASAASDSREVSPAKARPLADSGSH